MRLVTAELLKLRTTPTRWVFSVLTLVLWAVAVLANWGTMHVTLRLEQPATMNAEQQAQAAASADSANLAANLYTTGQFIGVLLVMLLGALLVTNEFTHRTATTTFLTTTNRTAVIGAKFAAAVLVGALVWLVTTALNLVVAPVLLGAYDQPALLGDPVVWRAIGLNLLAYAIWAVIGVGAGVLIRSQVGATLTLSIGYLVGYLGGSLFTALLASQFGRWFDYVQLLIPPLASQLLISGTELPGSPERWAGGVALALYALVMAAIGTWLVRRRDIS
jgi:ABC-type transport system involved in multi-copper enzyme maturation permease subunit